jgi:hypothetical protein
MSKWTEAQWVAECGYISIVTGCKGKVVAFNHDTECFKRYCEMQANEAHKQGFFDSEEYIRQCIDDLI